MISRLPGELSSLNSNQSENLARLVPTLLCGEQSAVCVFHNEAQRLSTQARRESAKLISGIERDELVHERLLSTLLHNLPALDELSVVKRRTRRFFVVVSRADNLAQHFSRIAQLDGSVCLIMHAMSRSGLARVSCLNEMFERLKRDEARHSFLSRQHALALGGSRALLSEEGASITTQLVDVLMPVAHAFDALEIDPDRLFSRILGTSRS